MGRRLQEVPVHGVGAGEQAVEALGPDRDHRGQADRRPEGIAPPGPFRDVEDALGRDAEFAGGSGVAGGGGEMAGDGLRTEPRSDPVAGEARVGEGLERGEALRPHHHQRARRIESVQRVAQVHRVEVRHHPHAWARLVPVLQRGDHHPRAEVRTPDPDVHDVGECHPARAADAAFAHAGGELANPGEDARGPRRGRPRCRAGVAGSCAQRDMQCGALLGPVDRMAREQSLGPGRQVAVGRKRDQQFQCTVVDAVARPVDEQSRGLQRVAPGAAGIHGEPLAQVTGGHRRCMRAQRTPGLPFGHRCHVGLSYMFG